MEFKERIHIRVAIFWGVGRTGIRAPRCVVREGEDEGMRGEKIDRV